MPGTKPPITPMTWVFISGIGFILFSALAILFGLYNDKLNLIRTSAYFFLLVPLGLMAAGFLFGALRSHAKYAGKAYGGTLELGGPVVVLALIILLGYKFRPAENAFSATVNVFGTGDANRPIANGSLVAYYGTAHVSKKISEGQVVLNEIPQEYRGTDITLVPEVEGYAVKEQKTLIPLTNTPINVYLEKLPDSVTVSGFVYTKNGKAVSHAVVSFADGRVNDSTDRFGNFRITLPFKDGTETRVRVYLGEELKENRLVILSSQTSVDIQLN